MSEGLSLSSTVFWKLSRHDITHFEFVQLSNSHKYTKQQNGHKGVEFIAKSFFVQLDVV